MMLYNRKLMLCSMTFQGILNHFTTYVKVNLFVRYHRFDSFTNFSQKLEKWLVHFAGWREICQFMDTPE
ncbi:hypothetical protein ED438_13195 [Salmonella enterica subsp. enterica serovar Gaminara]|nr:hypothetical protein [Salmonella enterica subsp. enterica serovar Minnesota]EBZ6325714.1 hypothetical protein [Salmonella enterica subsp. enterica serovar Gaminara]